MIYLLDTDMMIFLVRGLKTRRRTKRHLAMRQQSRQLVERCKHVQSLGDSIGVSAITVSELEYGNWRSEQYETEIEAVRMILRPFDLYDYEVVACVEHYGRIRYELEAAGRTIGALDLLIAAHVLGLNATLVTNNERHFRRISGLAVENWTRTSSNDE
jgi:tRNA(fMet)-specific endonuclease VapC